jgi:hypothetical protein
MKDHLHSWKNKLRSKMAHEPSDDDVAMMLSMQPDMTRSEAIRRLKVLLSHLTSTSLQDKEGKAH